MYNNLKLVIRRTENGVVAENDDGEIILLCYTLDIIGEKKNKKMNHENPITSMLYGIASPRAT